MIDDQQGSLFLTTAASDMQKLLSNHLSSHREEVYYKSRRESCTGRAADINILIELHAVELEEDFRCPIRTYAA